MSVESWGKGRPDYYKPSLVSRPIVVESADRQIEWVLDRSYTIAGMAASIDTFYTVPSGYSLSLGMVDVSANESCINKIRILRNSVLIGEFKFDMRGNLTMTDLSGQTLSAGDVLLAYVWNYNTVTDVFSVIISGILSVV